MYRKIKDKSGIMKILSNNGYDVTKSIFDSAAVVRSMNEYANEKVKEHLKALTKKIEDSHCYGFDDVLEDYLKENEL